MHRNSATREWSVRGDLDTGHPVLACAIMRCPMAVSGALLRV